MMEPGVLINDRYRVLRLLGEGGMGAVYEGEHTGVGRHVAIKVLHAEYARNAEIVERFQREARSAAAIGHDNIIDVYDWGVHDGAPYMVMEFLRGESLGDRITHHTRLDLESTSHIMGQVLSALAGAHAVGIVHRDLKPDNVFLVSKGGVKDYVKLLDFGISKFKKDGGQDGASSKGLTQTGAMMGTPYYMAPEQALAKADIDHRADLYSAGVMLYQMVTGVLPFDAESQAELLMAIVYRPQGLKPPREIVPEIPEAFEQIILRAMALDRTQRFDDAAHFAAALAPWSGALPSAPPSMPSHTSVPAGGSAVKGAQTLTPLNWQRSGTTQPDGTPESKTPAAPVAARTPRNRIALGGGIAAAVGTLALVAVLATRNREQPTPAAQVTRGESVTVPVALHDVSVDLEGVPDGASVTVDGNVAPGSHLAFVPGSSHTIRVSAPGKIAFETHVTAERDRTIVVTLGDLVAAPSTVAPDSPAVHTATTPATVSAGNDRHANAPARNRVVAAPPAVATPPAMPVHRPPAAPHSPLLAPSNEF